MVLARILLPVVLLLLSGSSLAVTLAWDANTEEDLAGYKIHWGAQPGAYSNTLDVGLVVQADVDIPTGSYIAATAYDTDENESAFSNEILYEINGQILPATGGQIYTAEIIIPVSGMRLGVDYEMQELPNGDIIIIFKHLAPGQRVRLEY